MTGGCADGAEQGTGRSDLDNRGDDHHVRPLTLRVRRVEAGLGEAVEGALRGKHLTAAGGVRLDAGQTDLRGPFRETVCLSRRRELVKDIRRALGMSERRACPVIGQPRSLQPHERPTPEGEAVLVANIIALARQ